MGGEFILTHLHRPQVMLYHSFHQLYFFTAEPQPSQNVGCYSRPLAWMSQEADPAFVINSSGLGLSNIMKECCQFEQQSSGATAAHLMVNVFSQSY